MKQLLGNLMLSAGMMLAVLPGVVSAQTPAEGDDKSRRSRAQQLMGATSSMATYGNARSCRSGIAASSPLRR